MASKQTKQKSQAKTRARNKKVNLSDLNVSKGGSVKGGDTPQKFLEVKLEDCQISSYQTTSTK